MTITTESRGVKHLIKVNGAFDYSIEDSFRQAYEKMPRNTDFLIDFSEVESMDSTALTMLLSFRDYAGGENSFIELVDCNPKIFSVLEVSNFHELFKIS